MNNQLTKLKSVKREEGFTIIEVLIVLAIGALIILAVLLAVPALQRNQDNSARKSEAARLAASIPALLSDNNNTTLSSSTDSELTTRAGLDNKGKLQTATFISATPTTISGTTAYYFRGTCNGNQPTYATTGTAYGVLWQSAGTAATATTFSACIAAQQ